MDGYSYVPEVQEQLTREQATQCLRMVTETIAQQDKHGADAAILQEPDVQCRGWCITLEETGIDFWPGWVLDRIGDDLRALGVFAEPVTHCHLGLYPG